MKKWVKRYIILLLCFLIAVLPIFIVVNSLNVLDTRRARWIFWGIIMGSMVVYFGVMSFFMFRGKKKIKENLNAGTGD